MRILIIASELKVRNNLRRHLEAEAYAVDVESDGEKGLSRAQVNDYDAILLDDVLPGKSCEEICREFRQDGKTAPIMVIGAGSEVEVKVGMLNDGADDYLAKPFAYEEMSARLRALLRRSRELRYGKLQIEDLVLDETNMTVIRAGEHAYLTAKEFAILRYLMRNAGRLVSRAAILEHVWDGKADPLSNMIETHMHNLRQKIDRPTQRKLIYTVSGRGYILQN